MAADDALQRGLGTARHDFGIALAMSLQQSEHNRLAVSAATTLATDPVRTERPVNSAALIAVKSRAKHRTSCLNLASLVFERR